MKRIWYYIILTPIICLLFGTTAFAGETFSIFTSSHTPNYSLYYISSASLANTRMESIADVQNNETNYWLYWDWSFNNTLTLTNSIGKYVYGAISVTLDLYIPNPNTQKLSWFAGVISGEPIITETLKIYPQIMTTANNHYIYKLIYVFDGYQPQNAELPGPLMTVSNIMAKWQDIINEPGTQGLTVTGTCTENYNYLRFEDTPLDRGLAGLIAAGIDDSVKIDMIMSYLYDIRENDIQYYSTLTSQAAQIITTLGNISSRLLIINNSINMGFEDVQTILDLFPDYITDVLTYWQQFLEMNQGQEETAAAESSEFAERESDSAQLLDGMSAISMPSLEAADFDLIGGLDTTQRTNFFGLIALITHTEIITKIMLVIVLGSIIGWVLYGKK